MNCPIEQLLGTARFNDGKAIIGLVMIALSVLVADGKELSSDELKTMLNELAASTEPAEDPQIAVTVNIPYGYSSSNAATVAKNVYRFYFGYMTLEDIISGGALDVYNVTIGD